MGLIGRKPTILPAVANALNDRPNDGPAAQLSAAAVQAGDVAGGVGVLAQAAVR